MRLTNKREIAEAMNFGKYPVLVLDRENHKGFEKYGDTLYCEGQKVRVAWDHKDPRYAGMTTQGNIYMDEDGCLAISGNGAMLKADWGYSDVMEDAEWANAPVVHKGQTVVVIHNWPSKKKCMVEKLKVSDRIDRFCITVATLEDVFE